MHMNLLCIAQTQNLGKAHNYTIAMGDLEVSNL